MQAFKYGEAPSLIQRHQQTKYHANLGVLVQHLCPIIVALDQPSTFNRNIPFGQQQQWQQPTIFIIRLAQTNTNCNTFWSSITQSCSTYKPPNRYFTIHNSNECVESECTTSHFSKSPCNVWGISSHSNHLVQSTRWSSRQNTSSQVRKSPNKKARDQFTKPEISNIELNYYAHSWYFEFGWQCAGTMQGSWCRLRSMNATSFDNHGLWCTITPCW